LRVGIGGEEASPANRSRRKRVGTGKKRVNPIKVFRSMEEMVRSLPTQQKASPNARKDGQRNIDPGQRQQQNSS